MSFLKGKIENNAGFAVRQPRGYPNQIWDYSYRFIRYEKCSLVLGVTIKEFGGKTKSSWFDEIQIPISELAVSSIKVKRDEAFDCFTVRGSIFNGQNKIRDLMQWTNSPGDSGSNASQISDFSIFFTDEELAQRVAKALAHAVNLCGGKKEAF